MIVEKKAEDVNIEEMAQLVNATKARPKEDKANRRLFDLDDKFKPVDLSRMVRPMTEEEVGMQVRRQKRQSKKAKGEK